MSEGTQSHMRKNYYIKKKFQYRFILKFCLVVLIGVICSTALLFYFSYGTLTTSFQQSEIVIKNTAYAVLPVIILSNLITLGLITTATIFLTLFVSHKIAGPLFRFEKELKEISDGDLRPKIKLRKNDQMTEMANELNVTVSSLRGKVLEIQDQVANIIEQAPQYNTHSNIAKMLNDLHENIRSNFKL